MSVRTRARHRMRPVRSPLQYLDHEHTFTPGMAKREGPGPFAGAPIVQGRWDGTGTPDTLTFPFSTEISGLFRSNMDFYQGSIVFWITPEWSGNDSLAHNIMVFGTNSLLILKDTDNLLYLKYRDATGLRQVTVDISAWNAGSTYAIAARFDGANKLDGTNHLALSVDDVHAFGASTFSGPYAFPGATHYIGSNTTPVNSADSLIEGLHVFRRVLYDGEFGVDANGVDEINAIWAAGVGADPTLITGSWDCVFAMPTDSAVGALVTGAGEAWSHPHSSNVPHQFFMADGYHGGNHNAVEYNATTTDVDCGSAAVVDNIPLADFTLDCWVRLDNTAAGARLFDKGTFLLFSQAGVLRVQADHAGTTALADIPFSFDGKWHHVMVVWDQGTLTFEHFFLDGRDLIQDVVVGIGAYTVDAGFDLHIGNRAAGDRTMDGAMAWLRLSDNKRETADFIAPRAFPAADGNTIEAWSFDDGTGATVVAQVASPGNDGTATNHTWITPWAEEGTPLSVQGIEFDGADTSVRIPDAVALQDLADDAFTAEGWFKTDSLGEYGEFFYKSAGAKGWDVLQSPQGLSMRVFAATTNAYSTSGFDEFAFDEKLHHFAVQFNDAGDRKIYLWLDGIPVVSYIQQTAAVGAVVSDIGNDLYLGNNHLGGGTFDGLLGGWSRISNISRYVNGKAFLPPAPTNAPGLDGNTVWQTDYADGAGATLTDDSATGSDGVITIGAGRWWNTRDANLNDAGEMPFGAGGYMFGTDAANEGIEQTWAGLTPGENYVVRAVVFPTADGNFYPQLAIRDETNGANIVLFNGPRYVGAHTGANNSATLINAGARWPQSLVGATVYNITDGSFGDITAISGDGTTITAALAGGTDDDWDTGDVHRIVWAVATDPINDGYWRHPWVETFCFELPTMARNGVGADCVSVSVRILNVNNDGTLVCAQLELLENLIDNPGMEAVYAGVPPIPPGWTNLNLDAGDTAQTVAVVHSGASAIQFNAAATSGELIQQNIAAVAEGDFVAVGQWSHTGGNLRTTSTRLAAQATFNSALLVPQVAGAVWQSLVGVTRGNADPRRFQVFGNSELFYVDDAYAFILDPVTLTVTPASEANSLESGGIRVDGNDALTQLVLNRLKARSGHIVWRGRLRHTPANLVAFWEGAEVTLVDAFGAAANYARVRATVLNTVDTRFDDGGGVQTVNWAAAGAWAADDELFLELYWRGHFMQLSVAGIPVATINQPVDFAVLPTLLYWGLLNSGGTNVDTVIKEP